MSEGTENAPVEPEKPLDESGLPGDAVVGNEPVGVPVDPPTDPVAIVEFVGEGEYGREFHSVRRITKAQFKAAHLDAPGDLEWTELNGWKQEVGLEFEDLLAFFRKDKGFRVHNPK